MSFLKNVKVKTKLIASYLIVSLLLLAIGTIGLVSLKKVYYNSTDMYENKLLSDSMLNKIKSLCNKS